MKIDRSVSENRTTSIRRKSNKSITEGRFFWSLFSRTPSIRKLENGGSDRLGDDSFVFRVQFYIREGHICEHFRTAQIWENGFTTVREFFWVNLSNSFDFNEAPVMGRFRGPGVRIFHQNWGGTIFGDPGHQFCRKFRHNSRTLGRSGWATITFFLSPILHKIRAHLRKFSNRPNLRKCPYYEKGIFLGRFIEFLRFAWSFGYGG